MKLIMTILDDGNCDSVSKALIENGFRVTRVASTGGFLRRGCTTLLIGVENDKVESAIEIMKDNVPSRNNPEENRATLFVIDVENFRQI